MFNFAWSELAVIAVVALIAIGPKDMPAAIRAITTMIKKARGMAAEFQGHVDDLMREADLGSVRDQLNELRNFDVRGAVEKAVDPDGTLRDTLTTDPFAAASPALTETAGTNVAEHGTPAIARPEDADPVAGAEAPVLAAIEAPAFVPPFCIAAVPATVGASDIPAFVPPASAAARLSPPA